MDWSNVIILVLLYILIVCFIMLAPAFSIRNIFYKQPVDKRIAIAVVGISFVLCLLLTTVLNKGKPMQGVISILPFILLRSGYKILTKTRE